MGPFRSLFSLSCIVISHFSLPVVSLMYDVIESSFIPSSVCTYGCAQWSNLLQSGNTANQTYVNSLWGSLTVQTQAKNSCAMPANFLGTQDVPMTTDGDTTTTNNDNNHGLTFDFSFGPQCYCAGNKATNFTTTQWGYCTDPVIPTPQQIHVQFGSKETNIIVSFTTIDFNQPSIDPPTVEWCTSAKECTNYTGTSSFIPEPQNTLRIHSYHYVPIDNLPFDSSFSYRCIGGTAQRAWSETFHFRTRKALPSPTQVSIVGDLGIYPFNCFTNLLQDSKDKVTDFFIHLGDHSYNMAMDGGLRGDAYMLGFQPILTSIPWLSVMGNHEYEGSPFGEYCQSLKPPINCEYRYLNQTGGLLAIGNASQSYTNRYYSIDIGYLHVIVLDYNYYLGLEPLEIATAQLEWLKNDLQQANNNRDNVPWIMIAAHAPMYCSSASISKEGGSVPVDPLTGEPRFSPSTNGGGNDPPSPYNGCQGTGTDVTAALIKEIEPLMFQYGVDLHVVGHEHNYENTWPVGPNGTVHNPTFTNPAAPVHVVTGAGGAPAYSGFSAPGPFTRKQIMEWSYSRVIIYNSTTLAWEQIANNNGTVLDSWIIQQSNHGPFPTVNIESSSSSVVHDDTTQDNKV